MMTVRLLSSRAIRVCQPHDNVACEQNPKNTLKDETPEHWELTKQQQAFIALFTEDDHKKH